MSYSELTCVLNDALSYLEEPATNLRAIHTPKHFSDLLTGLRIALSAVGVPNTFIGPFSKLCLPGKICFSCVHPDGISCETFIEIKSLSESAVVNELIGVDMVRREMASAVRAWLRRVDGNETISPTPLATAAPAASVPPKKRAGRKPKYSAADDAHNVRVWEVNRADYRGFDDFVDNLPSGVNLRGSVTTGNELRLCVERHRARKNRSR